MNVKTLGAALILAGTLVMSGNAGGAQATGTLRPEAVQTSYGSLDLLVDINSGSNSSDAKFGPILNGKMLFSARTASAGNELWITDGTPTGTTFLKDIRTGSDSSSINNMTLVGDKVYFSAYDATNGGELWVTDGSANGTVPIDIYPGSNGGYPNSSFPSSFYAFGSQVLFRAETALGQELWVTNGTAEGTTLLKDINTVSTHSSPRFFTEFNGMVYFSANDGINGTELWVTNGTANGTTLVKDIYIGASSSEVSDLIVFQGKLFFEAYNAATGYEMWSSDGTPDGTTLFKDIRPGSDSSSLNYPIVLGDKLLFTADDGTNGRELWSSNGTPEGTTLLKDIYTGSGSGWPDYMVKIGDFVYFFASDATTGYEPWKSDGTSSGTVRIADIRTGTNGSLASCSMCYSEDNARFRQYGETVIIVADDGVNGAEPWISGGSITGANLLSDVRPGSSGSLAPSYGEGFNSAVVGGKYLFTANNGQVGTEIWTFSSPPGAPTTVTATPSTNSAIVSWTAPTSTSIVSSYTVTSNPGAFTCTSATLSCTITGLLSNQDYTFTVVATSTVGSGPASAASPRVRTLSPQLGSLLNSLTAVTNIISDNDFTPGESFTAFYTGFNANEMVLMVMASNPVVIGSTNADANGNVAITGVIPSNATVGNHTLALYAPVSGFGAKQAITVTNSVPASGSGGSTSGASSTPSVDPSTLPATGQGSNPSLLAYLLLILGIGLLAGRRIVAPLARDRPR
jgi:ELWxxDGT repeat protein